MKSVEHVRKQVMEDLWSNAGFRGFWNDAYKDFLVDKITKPNAPHRDEIVNLGDFLSGAFQSLAIAGRSNTSVSRGGEAWERLVVWYLNVCLMGTNALAIKPKKPFLPEKIGKALTITYNNVRVRSEPDLLLLHNPLLSKLGEGDPSSALADVHEILNEFISQTYVINLQCKTNWNDSSQIPMLWGLVYSHLFSHESVSVGIDGFNPTSLGGLRYGFMTVPSQKDLNKFKPTSVDVARVQTLSGGNYWGRPSKTGVVSSIKQIFNKSYPSFIPSVPAVGSAYSIAIKNGRTEEAEAFKFL